MVTYGSISPSMEDIQKLQKKEISERDKLEQKRIDCEARGGYWDSQNKVCLAQAPTSSYNIKDLGNLPTASKPGETKTTETPITQTEVKPTGPEYIRDQDTGRITGVRMPDGRIIQNLTPSEVNSIVNSYNMQTQAPAGASPLGTAERNLKAGMQAQQLQQQVGQFQETPVSPTGIDYGEAATTGIINSIPRALSLAATGAGIGLVGGGGVGSAVPILGTTVGAGAGAAIGATVGFVGSISSSIISNMRDQRTDTVNAQKRVLDEGKQTMKDWITLASADPGNSAYYLSQYNKVSSQINSAYRQMQLDTRYDIAKFETALPDLAEFEAFYSPGGERDTLDDEMRNALLTPGSPEYQMLELTNRRKQ